MSLDQAQQRAERLVEKWIESEALIDSPGLITFIAAELLAVQRETLVDCAKVCRDHAELVQSDIGKALLLQELAELFERGPRKIQLNSQAIRGESHE